MSSKKLFMIVLVLLSFMAFECLGAQKQEQFDETGRLAMLSRVWGFLKYYHPQKNNTFLSWDESLMRTIPLVRQARDREEFSEIMVELIREAGGINPVDFHELKPGSPPSEPFYGWMGNDVFFTPKTRLLLHVIRRNCSGENPLTYYQMGTGIIDTTDEVSFRNFIYPSVDMRLLALFRFWNVIEYFFPYKQLMDQPWDEVLPDMIPVFIDVADKVEYALAVRELTARINDSHAFLESDVLDTFFWGNYYPPFKTKTVEQRIVVVKQLEDYPDGVQVGDVVLAINGESVEAIRARYRKYIQASNEAFFERRLNLFLFRGPETDMVLSIERDGLYFTVTVPRVDSSRYSDLSALGNSGPVYRWLEDNIGYVHMGRLSSADVTPVMNELMSAKAIIFDIRNYPQVTLYLLAKILNPRAVSFVRFTRPDSKRPGFFLMGYSITCGPISESNTYYKGKVVILFNEETISQAEFTCMALQTAPDVISIGSQTAGADGNVTPIFLPGGMTAYFTGLGVYYPDGRDTQRIGIVPDIRVTPTIDGIRRGGDEVLDRAIAYIEAHVN